MYFANTAHEENYKYLMNMYSLSPGEDVQYEASIYIAAYPEIFKCFGEINKGFGPLVGLVDEEFAEEGGHDVGALTGSTHRMVEFGMSLYNGFEVSLDDIFGSITDDEKFNVLIQAIKIRAKKM